MPALPAVELLPALLPPEPAEPEPAAPLTGTVGWFSLGDEQASTMPRLGARAPRTRKSIPMAS
jgi:hypothetical protein